MFIYTNAHVSVRLKSRSGSEAVIPAGGVSHSHLATV